MRANAIEAALHAIGASATRRSPTRTSDTSKHMCMPFYGCDLRREGRKLAALGPLVSSRQPVAGPPASLLFLGESARHGRRTFILRGCRHLRRHVGRLRDSLLGGDERARSGLRLE